MAIITVGNTQTVYFIVDSESLAHIGYYAFTSGEFPFKTTKGLLKGAFHGFFLMLKNQVERHSPEDMYFCWGDKRENLLRKQLYSNYKEHRNSDPKVWLQEQIVDIQLSISLMGYLQYGSTKGYEGDDVIASVVKDIISKRQNLDYKIIILSNDKDMLQLVSDRISVCTPSHSNYVEYTPEIVKEKYGITPEQLSDYFCLVGDSSDNVPGITGIGPKTATQLINDNGNIVEWFNSIENIKASRHIKGILLNNRTNMIISKKLVSLNNYSAPLDKIVFNNNTSPDQVFDKYEMTGIRPHNFLLI